MPFDDHMMISTPALWPGPVCCVKRNTKSPSMENYGYVIRNDRNRTVPTVHTEVGVTFCYDSIDDLIAAGWIVD